MFEVAQPGRCFEFEQWEGVVVHLSVEEDELLAAVVEFQSLGADVTRDKRKSWLAKTTHEAVVLVYRVGQRKRQCNSICIWMGSPTIHWADERNSPIVAYSEPNEFVDVIS